MEGIAEPVDRDLARALRRAVLDLATAERRRHFPARLHVGLPAGRRATFDPAEGTASPLDHALRTDVVAAMVRRTTGPGSLPIVWLTRAGELDLQDTDADWLAAARSAYAEAGLPLTMVVVTRRGWRDPRSGTCRRWRRPRDRSRGSIEG